MSASNDGSESVDQFLARIASVKEGRDDGEERKRRMEEEFLKNRTERQARRLERARSLSPSKTGPSRPLSSINTPSDSRDTVLNPPVDFSPQGSQLSRSNAVRTSPTLNPKRLEPESNVSPVLQLRSSPQDSPGLSRSGTLSWQQRPVREGSSRPPRPLSTIATVRVIPSQDVKQPESPKEQTREEIAASLGSKDPTWFRQTQDRGKGSAAYRKNQVEDAHTPESAVQRMRLPGLSQVGSGEENIASSEKDAALPSPKQLPSQHSIPKSSPAVTDIKSGSSPKLAKIQHDSSTPEPKSPTSVLSARSPSPTKGLGGFVQSAMMKRSDSVSKRWTVQANAGLRRGDSVAGGRPLSGTTPNKSFVNQGVSPTSPNKSSVSSQDRNTQQFTENIANVETPVPVDEKLDLDKRPRTPPERGDLNRSPSKTLDSRNWSPTKSSWLESALLTKQEPPKIMPKKEEQPQWMANLQRSKSMRDRSPEKKSTQEINTQVGSSKTETGVVAQRDREQSAEVERTQSMANSTPDILQESSKGASKSFNAGTVDDQMKHERVDQDTSKGFLRLEVSEKRPPTVKPKPQTPPKTDFRATLRSRALSTEQNDKNEPEFKSMFGKLKPAQTKNYVAPDTFKNNILSGKAALNVTGGPQKTKRIDEFKESILEKKEAMKASALEKQQKPNSEEVKVETAVPEALQRRKTLHKATPSVTKIQDQVSSVEINTTKKQKPALSSKPKPTATDEDKDQTRSPRRTEQLGPTQQPMSKKSPVATSPVTSQVKLESLQQSSAKQAVIRTGFAQEKPVMAPSVKTPVTQMTSTESLVKTPSNEDRPKNSSNIQTLVPQSLMEGRLPAGSKLASRLNPNLAGFLARGGGASPVVVKPIQDDQSLANRATSSPGSEANAQASTELTHMTKGRAKGPKRRAPQAVSESVKAARPSTTKKSATLIADKTNEGADIGSSPSAPEMKTKTALAIAIKSSTTPELQSSSNTVTSILVQGRGDNTLVKKEDSQTILRGKPTVAMKSPNLKNEPVKPAGKSPDPPGSKPVVLRDFKIAKDEPKTHEVASETSDSSQQLRVSAPSVAAQPLSPNQSRVNAPKPRPEKPSSPKPIHGNGVQVKSPTQRTTLSSEVPQSSTPVPKTKITNDSSVAVDVSQIVNAYFTNYASPKAKAEFDTQALLENAQGKGDKCKTLSNMIWELGGGGKKMPMPPQQEHILFEESMYLMIHAYEASGSKLSEVYLWVGDRVPSAAVEDVQIFCKKDAREHNAKLELIKQGREPQNFFQALGGIVITRRSKNSALYMLCGRKHLDHIAFDEVDLSVSSLCSGFPYLISAQFGNLFLWKGKGSAADEVGCARLIGMDLGLTGEIVEIDEGFESTSFWETFSEPATRRIASENWQTRNDHRAYPCSMFRIDNERPKSSAGGFWGLRSSSPPKPTNRAAIELIEPFCQHDLEAGGVYVLDAYWAVYVLLDSKATSDRTAACVTALHLAQEIAMLSPAIQGRSLLPSCQVVFGEPPSEIIPCFRKWTDGFQTTNDQPSACVRLEDVMQALGL